jgi:hypothetical protein
LFTLKLYIGNISKRKMKGKMSKDKDSPKKINSNLKEKITTAIVEMVVKDYLPLSFVE